MPQPAIIEPDAPKTRRSLRETVYLGMVQRIFSGEFPFGERLPTEEELARGFDVSRVTMRHALLKLRECRLVVSLQGSGNYVGGLPLDDTDALGEVIRNASLSDTLDFRVGLEVQAASMAARNRTDHHLSKMHAALVAHELKGEPSVDWLIGFRQADLEFHDAITEACANPILECMLKALNPMFTMRWLDWTNDIGESFPLIAKDVWNEHMMILNAIVARDSDMARVAMQFHLKPAQQRVKKTHSTNPAFKA